MVDMSAPFDINSLSDADRVAFAGALFAIAAIDGSLDREELSMIFDVLVFDDLSPTARAEIQSYLVTPPELGPALERLAHADETLRHGLLMMLVDIALADDLLTNEEHDGLVVAQIRLGITDEQLQEMINFCRKVREIRARGLNDDYAEDAIKNAVAGLSAVGVPIAAIYFSGSVVSLSAAGITSGLAALGLGGLLGLSAMVTGIGVVVLMGVGIYMGVSQWLDIGGNHEKERLCAIQERKAQMVIANLQEAINGLIEEIRALQADTIGTRGRIIALQERLKRLQSILNQRQAAMEGEAVAV
jgi:uncharacterized tellurite resistance protein B-like protein